MPTHLREVHGYGRMLNRRPLYQCGKQCGGQRLIAANPHISHGGIGNKSDRAAGFGCAIYMYSSRPCNAGAWRRQPGALPCRSLPFRQDAFQPNLARSVHVGGFSQSAGALSVAASQAPTQLSGVPGLCCAVNLLSTSVVPEIGTLRSVGAGGASPPLAREYR
jgi:hypothetical protein